MRVEELLSVIVPVYNAAEHLHKCVASILTQTYKNLDIILINDGSSDNSGHICDELAESDRRIRVYHTENQGVVLARSYGVKMARGNLITFVDSDDWIESDMYLQMLNIFDEYGSDIIVSGIIYDDPAGVRLEYDLIPEGIYERQRIEREIIPTMMFDVRRHRRAVTSAVWNKIIRKSLWEEASQGIDCRITYGEDAAIVYLCLARAESIFFINNAWYHYYVNGDSMVHSFNISSFEKIKFFMDYMEGAYKKLGIWSQMKMQLMEYTKSFLYPAIETVYNIKLGPVYLFPYELVKADSQVIIYGAGNVGRAYMRNLIQTNYVRIVAWVDKAYEKFQDLEEQVQSPHVVSELIFDYIVIAIENEQTVSEIKQYLMSIGIPRKRIVWKNPEIIEAEVVHL